jgi:drug/metabolite transporter (DMT)-like permease
MWGHDTFSWTKPLSAIFIFLGVYFVTTSKSREDLEKEQMKHMEDHDLNPLILSPVKESVNKFGQ